MVNRDSHLQLLEPAPTIRAVEVLAHGQVTFKAMAQIPLAVMETVLTVPMAPDQVEAEMQQGAQSAVMVEAGS
jgi:hypothetical protein